MKTVLQIFIISLLFVSCLSNPKQKTESLRYEIVSKQDKSYINTSRMAYKILLDVDSIPTDEELKNTAMFIWKNEEKKWDEFSVSFYLPDMNTESLEYGIVNFNIKGLSSFFKYEISLKGTEWKDNKIETPIDPKRIQEPSERIKETQSPKLNEYKIYISTIDAGERKLKINIRTNFPDGTNLNIDIWRAFNVKGDNEIHVGNLYQKDFSVTNEKFETLITINDAEWYNKYRELVRDLPNDFSPISRISENITIDVLYTAAAPQPATVKSILGASGEFVSGQGVGHFGTGTAGRITTLRVSKEILIPRVGSTQKQTEIVNYQALKLNTTYAVSKETPLMPEFEPSDPLAAMNNIKYLQAGSRIRILSINHKYNNPWYEVNAISNNGKSIGKGWINSTALIGQDILIIK